MDNVSDIREQIFHNTVREQIIFLLLFLCLYLGSFSILGQFKRNGKEDYYSSDEDEIIVYRISTWICSVSLAVSIGSILLLPISIVSNEVMVNYPDNYYIQWLNSSFIQGLWNYVFLLSNMSMYLLLPFAYFFTESEGCFGNRRGLLARTYETCIVLILVTIVIMGLSLVLNALFNEERSGSIIIFNLWSYLPFLYSCISFLGGLILLICTPIGFIHLFDVVGKFLIKPQFLFDLNEEYSACAFQEEYLTRKLKLLQHIDYPKTLLMPMSPEVKWVQDADYQLFERKLNIEALQYSFNIDIKHICRIRRKLDEQKRTSSIRRNIVYPTTMLLLIGLTGIAVLLVIQNTLSLLIGIKVLPSSSKQFTLGVSSLSKLGPFGSALEITMIVYFIATSSTGLYTLLDITEIRPKFRSTPFTLVLSNCALMLTTSSALPLLSKTLGITNFDLLGEFGSIEWLGNFNIVLLYNVMFASVSSFCIVNKFTSKVRRELYARLVENYVYISNCVSFLN